MPSDGEYVDVRDIHPDYETMTCWKCGHEERIGPNRQMRICHHCFMDNRPAGKETENTADGPDGKQYVDYRLVWYGDVSIEEAQRRYERKTSDIDTGHEVTVRL